MSIKTNNVRQRQLQIHCGPPAHNNIENIKNMQNLNSKYIGCIWKIWLGVFNMIRFLFDMFLTIWSNLNVDNLERMKQIRIESGNDAKRN